MKNLFIPAVLSLFFVSCGDNAELSAPTAESQAVVEPNFVMPIEYSSKFEMGDPKKSEQIVQLWKDFDDNKLEAHSDYFADSVVMDFPGSSFKGSRDSLLVTMKGYRSSLNAVNSKIDAILSVKSTDKNEDWVLIWGREYITSPAGKIDSAGLHEIWRFNTGGKVDYMSQFKQDPPAPQK